MLAANKNLPKDGSYQGLYEKSLQGEINSLIPAEAAPPSSAAAAPSPSQPDTDGEHWETTLAGSFWALIPGGAPDGRDRAQGAPIRGALGDPPEGGSSTI